VTVRRNSFCGVLSAGNLGDLTNTLRATCHALDASAAPAECVAGLLAGISERRLCEAAHFGMLFAGYVVSDGFDERMRACVEKQSFADLCDCDGPFCVAAIDERAKAGYLIRDKFGLRPLFYAFQHDVVWFADDVRFLLYILNGPPVRPQGLIEWSHYGAALQPLSLFEGIYTLPAGSILRFDLLSGTHVVTRYFKPQQLVSRELHDELQRRPLASIEAELEQKLDNAVARACNGHERVTILMSGGVDSSLIAAMAVRHTKVLGLTVDVVGPGAQTEVEYAAAVARHLGIEHRVCRFGREEFLSTLPEAIAALGTPIIVENAVALYYAAQSGAIPPGELMLDGEGGDALFCGSPHLFKYSMILMSLASMSGIPTRYWRSVLERLRVAAGRLGLATKSTLDRPGLDAMLGGRRLQMDLLTQDLLTAFEHIPDQAQREVAALMLREFYDYLVPLMLRIDTMSRAARTHVILPFLDTELFRFAENIPLRCRIRWSWRTGRPVTKWIEKRLASRLLPRELMYRPKGGFGIPGALWLRRKRPGLAPEFLAQTFGIPCDEIAVWADGQPRSRDCLFLWTMEMWGRIFSPDAESASAETSFPAFRKLHKITLTPTYGHQT
jgi:asparagine synthase (glutamine-hydrolysing)